MNGTIVSDLLTSAQVEHFAPSYKDSSKSIIYSESVHLHDQSTKYGTNHLDIKQGISKRSWHTLDFLPGREAEIGWVRLREAQVRSVLPV